MKHRIFATVSVIVAFVKYSTYIHYRKLRTKVTVLVFVLEPYSCLYARKMSELKYLSFGRTKSNERLLQTLQKYVLYTVTVQLIIY